MGMGPVHQDALTPFYKEILNSMMMVAGGQNYLLDTSESQHTQGCALV